MCVVVGSNENFDLNFCFRFKGMCKIILHHEVRLEVQLLTTRTIIPWKGTMAKFLIHRH